MAWLGYWIGSFVGTTAVVFLTMLIFMKIIKIVVERKCIGVQIKVVQHALIVAMFMGFLGNTIFTPGLMGKLSIIMIVLAIIALVI